MLMSLPSRGRLRQKKSRAAKRSNFATLLVFLLPATGALHALLRILFLFWFLKTVQSLDPEGPSYYDFYYEDYLMETFAMMRLAMGYRHKCRHRTPRTPCCINNCST